MEYLVYAILGLSSGAIIGFVALGIVIGYRASGVVNFAQGAIGMYTAYVYLGLRNNGRYVNPIIGMPNFLQIGPKSGMDALPALAIALATGALLGYLLHRLVFRPMRGSPPLAQVVASVGVLLLLESIIAFRFGTNPVAAPMLLPKTATISLGGTFLPNDRVILTVVLPVLALGLWAVYRFTKFGLATRGAAENEKAAVLLGISPDAQAAISWIAAALLGGIGAILAAQLTSLTPTGYTLIVIPALAAALTGRLTSVGITVACAFGIGALQSVLTNLSNDLPWWPPGTPDALPFLVIAVVMFVVGRSLPQRGAIGLGRLPFVPQSGARVWPAAVAAIVCCGLLFVAGGGLRVAIMTSVVGALICLSLVVLTGYVGQISLFQLTLAGVAAYLLAYLTTYIGIPFPIAPIVAAAGGALLGLVAAVPALRVRGINLAIVTLAFGFAVDQTIFANPTINGGFTGLAAVPPKLFGLDLAFTSGATVARPAFGIFVLVVLALCALGVSNLRRSRTGRRMLAVRSDEQAAAAAGINVARTKIAAFIVAGFLAGLAGTLIAYQQSVVSGTNFAALASVTFLAVAYLGGITSVPGAMIGGFLVAGGINYWILDELVFSHVRNGAQLQNTIVGLALILMAVMNPEGIAGATAATGRAVRRRWRPNPPGPIAADRARVPAEAGANR